MKHLGLVLLLAAGPVGLPAQPSVVLQRSYAELPFALRIENSGIYGIDALDITEDTVRIASNDAHSIAVFCAHDHYGSMDLSSGTGQSLLKKKSFGGMLKGEFQGRDGTLNGGGNARLQVVLTGPHAFTLFFTSGAQTASFMVSRADEIAFADIIGVDRYGNTILLVESYVQHIPLRIRREVLSIDPAGTIRAAFEIPLVKYCTTLKDLDIDAEGNVYQLLSDRTGITVVRWPAAGAPIGELPSELATPIHFNECVPVAEPPRPMRKSPLVLSSRMQALKIAEGYITHRYVCAAANLSPADVTAPDGDVVRTPSWLIEGINARLPYKWGGFNTVAQFDAGLREGRFSGDINTSGESSYAVGVDCSGYVSRCWQLGYHSSTADMPGITAQYASWNELKPGDAIHKVGHVRLFVERTSNGAFRVAEAAGRDWSVNYWTYLPSDLVAYTPRFYTAMGEDYCASRPTLMSVVPGLSGSVCISWSCDTSGVAGYRVYASANGASWAALRDVAASEGTSCEVPSSSAQFFRVAAIGATVVSGESQWSNALGAGQTQGTRRVLVVSGYERETGSWRGPGELFSIPYGVALASCGVTFHSCRNSEIVAGNVHLADYTEVFWLLGDEGTLNESFSSTEQALVAHYLESGGNLFVTGSETGYDLVEKGASADQAFYQSYLKAQYISDDAGSRAVVGQLTTLFEGVSFAISQSFDEDYPDEIEGTGGAVSCFRYENGKGAAIQYSGLFGSGVTIGKLIHLGFPLESTANDTSLALVVTRAMGFFASSTPAAVTYSGNAESFSLEQNYPNPFNPKTVISSQLPVASWVRLVVCDVLGKEVAVLLDEYKAPGTYRIDFDGARLSSGVYICRMTAGDFVECRKMVLTR